MRIEILANGPSSVIQMQHKFADLHADIESTVQSLKNVRNRINGLPGGVENLSAAVDMLGKRIQQEQENAHLVEQLVNKASKFLKNAVAADSRAAQLIAQSQKLFFEEHERLRPPENGFKTWWEERVADWNKFWGGVGDAISHAWEGIVDFTKAAGDYVWRSLKKLILGDYSDDNITLLSFVANLVASFFDVDLPMDIRDLVYDIQHWGEDDHFALFFILDVVALIPVIGMLKNLKYVDDIADAADAISDAAKAADQAADILDDSKDISKAIDNAADLLDDASDLTDNASDFAKNADVIWETARKRKYLFYDDTLRLVDDSGEMLNEVKNVERISDFKYAKKPMDEYKTLRETFDKVTRGEFLKNLATNHVDELKKLGLTDDQISDMLDGITPKGFQVHHKLPLDDGGDNSFKNLILIDDNTHSIFTGYQNAFSKKKDFKETGEAIIDWFVPKGNVYIP